MRTLHVQQRGTPPPFYIDCRIGVGMKDHAAAQTGKDRLAFAASSVYGPALRACLRGVSGIYECQSPTAFSEFVFEHGREDCPALSENSSVETGLLSNVSSRLSNCASRRSRHFRDAQPFQRNRPETSCQVGRYLVQPVPTDAGRSGVQLSYSCALSRMPFRPSRATSKNFLRFPSATFDNVEVAWRSDQFTRRQSHRIGNATVYSNPGPKINWGFMLNFARKGDVPAIRVKRYGRIQQLANKRPGASELQPSDFRQPHRKPFGIQALGFDLTPREAECIVPSFASRGWIPRSASEEACVRSIKIPQSLLLARDLDGSDPIELRAKSCEIGSLVSVAKPVFPTPDRALLKSKIVDQTADARELLQQGFLFNSRGEQKAEAAMDHERIITFSQLSRKSKDILAARTLSPGTPSHDR